MTTITSTTKPAVGKILPTSEAKKQIDATKAQYVLVVEIHSKEKEAAKKVVIKDLSDELVKYSRSGSLTIVIAQERSQ